MGTSGAHRRRADRRQPIAGASGTAVHIRPAGRGNRLRRLHALRKPPDDLRRSRDEAPGAPRAVGGAQTLRVAAEIVAPRRAAADQTAVMASIAFTRAACHAGIAIASTAA